MLCALTISCLVFCSKASVFSAWTNDGYKEGFDVSMELNNLDEINPYWYNLGEDDDGLIKSNHGLVNERAYVFNATQLDSWRMKHYSIIHAIGDTAYGQVNAIMGNQSAIQVLKDQILSYVDINDYDGIDLNFEATLAGGRTKERNGILYSGTYEQEDNFQNFLCELQQELHNRNKGLHLTTQCETSTHNDYYIYSNYSRTGQCVDRVKVMTYDYQITIANGNIPQPTQPLAWMIDVLRYTINYKDGLAGVDSGIVQIGVLTSHYCFTRPQGGDWVGYNPFSYYNHRALTTDDYILLTENITDVENVWLDDTCILEAYSQWTSNGAEFLCTMPTKETIENRLAVVRELGLAGIAVWHLGKEDTSIYQNFKNSLIKLPTIDTNACKVFYQDDRYSVPMPEFFTADVAAYK
eukprot:Awhi_evm1s1310